MLGRSTEKKVGIGMSNINLKPEIGEAFFCILGTLTVMCASKRAITPVFVAAERDQAVHIPVSIEQQIGAAGASTS